MKNIIIFEIKHSNNNCIFSTCKLSVVKFAEGNSGCRSCRSISCSTGLAHGNYVPRPAWRLHRALLFLRNPKQCHHAKLSSLFYSWGQLRLSHQSFQLARVICLGNGKMGIWIEITWVQTLLLVTAIWTGGVLSCAHSLRP